MTIPTDPSVPVCTPQAGAIDVGTYNVEDCYREDEVFVGRRFKIKCQKCQRTNTPFSSPRTQKLGQGIDWMGMDYQYTYVKHDAICRCGQVYTFRTYMD